jgi:hypothetical protein
MRAILLAATLFTSPALSHQAEGFDLWTAVHVLKEENYVCFSGQELDGSGPAPEEVIKSACLETVALLQKIRAHGWCHVKATDDWVRCE